MLHLVAWYMLVLILGTVAFVYLFGPLVFLFIFRSAADPELIEINFDDSQLPRELSDYFRSSVDILESLGFAVLGTFSLPRQPPKTKAFLILMANRAKKDLALVIFMYADIRQGKRLQYAWTEFETRFGDGSVVETNNSNLIITYRSPPSYSVFRFPMVDDPGRLYRLHQALLDRHGSRFDKFFRLDEEFHGDASAYVAQAALREALDAQVAAGYLYLSTEDAAYRATTKGAYLMTWGQLWPFKAFTRIRRRREAFRLLAELES